MPLIYPVSFNTAASLVLGGDATAGQTFTGSDTDAGHPLANLFDDNNATDWFSGTDDTGWVRVQFSSAKAIGRYSLRSQNTADYDRTPLSWTLKASNTGSFAGEEVTIDTFTTSTWTQNERRQFDVANTTAYIYYRFTYLTKTNALGKGNEYTMSEMEMMAYS